MTQEQFVSRKERAQRDFFVITAAEEGWRMDKSDRQLLLHMAQRAARRLATTLHHSNTTADSHH